MCAFSIRCEREGSASRVIWRRRRRPRSVTADFGSVRGLRPDCVFLAGWRFNLKWELAPAPTAGQIVWKKDGRTDGPTPDGRTAGGEGRREGERGEPRKVP